MILAWLAYGTIGVTITHIDRMPYTFDTRLSEDMI